MGLNISSPKLGTRKGGIVIGHLNIVSSICSIAGLVISILTLLVSGSTHHRVIEHKTRKSYHRLVDKVVPNLKSIRSEMDAGKSKPEHRSKIIEDIERLQSYSKYFTPKVKKSIGEINTILTTTPSVDERLLAIFFMQGKDVKPSIPDNQPLIDALSKLIGSLSVRKETLFD